MHGWVLDTEYSKQYHEDCYRGKMATGELTLRTCRMLIILEHGRRA